MNPLPEFLEPISEFEMWQQYREKRNRRAFYFLALLLILLIVASALPSSTGPVFGTGSNSSNIDPNGDSNEVAVAGKDGKDGEDGRNGENGLPGRDGTDGQDGSSGAPGPSGPEGPAGPAGPPGEPGEPGLGSGQGVLRVGTCDTAITVALRSRLVSGVFYFKRIVLSEISTDCNGKSIDVYLLDETEGELSTYTGEVNGSTLSIDYTSFTTSNIMSSALKSVALEIAD